MTTKTTKTKARHTKGPWRRGYSPGYGRGRAATKTDVLAGDQIVARCHIPPRYDAQRNGFAEDAIREMEANACLVAAAPDQLIALQGVAVMLRTALRQYAHEPWARQVVSAIRKAQEEPPHGD